MSDKPRVLIINPILPFPPNQGSKVVTFGLIKALKSDFDVTVLCRVLSPSENEVARDLENWCERVVTVIAPNRKSVFHRIFYKAYYYLISLTLRRSLKTLYDCPGSFVRAARALAKEDFDLVIIVYWQLRKMLGLFPPSRCVLATFDIDMLVNRQVSLLERNLMRKIRAVQRWLVEQKEEIAAYRESRHVWTLTERDKLVAESLSRNSSSVKVLPFGVDVDFHSPSGMKRNPAEVLFMGYLGALFNLDALEYFVHRIYPHLDEVEGMSITVVGGNLPKEMAYFGLQPEVEIVGRVPDIRPYLHRASCLVIPLRFGGGLRIRVLEAMAAELPVVCTPVAIAGMPFESETHFLQGTTPEEFATQIKRVLEDPKLGEKLAGAACERVREMYGIEAQTARSVALVRDLIEADRAHPNAPKPL